MKYDKAIRTTAVLLLVTVGVIAAVISFSHIYDLGLTHGQRGAAGRLLPFSVDGLIVAASMVYIGEARRGRTDKGARAMLLAGVLATIGANVAYGVAYGTLGAAISAWPAFAFIGSAEVVVGMIRRAGTEMAVPVAPVPVPVPRPRSGSGTHARTRGGPPLEEAVTRYADALQVGRLPTVREIKADMQVGQANADKVRAHLQGKLNDSQPVPPEPRLPELIGKGPGF